MLVAMTKAKMRLVYSNLASVLLVLCWGNVQAQELDTGGNSRQPPNVLFIVADDMGFSDVGAFGGAEIRTPNIDSLAQEGVRLTNFHTLPTCAPTRSVLLTGADNHQAGIGSQVISEAQQGQPGYEGYLNDRVVTLAEVLSQQGYRTYQTGKWHLGDGPGHGPTARGFQESFALMPGGASHFADQRPLHPAEPTVYTRNDKVVDTLPEDFYSTRSYTDFLLQWLQRDADQQQPFFAYLAYTAPHDPLQAPPAYIAKYHGVYDEGYERLRERRFNQLKALGLIEADHVIPPWPAAIPRWDALSDEEKQASSRDMEIYAAMIDYMDEQIGRVLGLLAEQGKLENTLIVFMSDNGANGTPSKIYSAHTREFHDSFDNSLDNRGASGSFVSMGAGWATASTAAFKLFKVFLTEGGIRTPAIIVPPGGLSEGVISNELVEVRDIVPSVLALVGTEHPSVHNSDMVALQGRAVLPVLTNGSGPLPAAQPIGYELHGARAYVEDGWKALQTPMPIGSGQWQLFNLSQDPGETNDLAQAYPDRLAELKEKQASYEANNGVVYAPPAGIANVQRFYRGLTLALALMLLVTGGMAVLRAGSRFGKVCWVVWSMIKLALLAAIFSAWRDSALLLLVGALVAEMVMVLITDRRKRRIVLTLLTLVLLAILILLGSDLGLRMFLKEY